MRRYRFHAAGIVVASALLFSVRNLQYNTGVFNDDAAYVLAAQSIGAPDPGLESLVRPRPDFPFPGLPYLLAPLVKVVAPHCELLEWLFVVVGIVAVILFALWMQRWVTPQESLLGLMIYAFNPIVAKYSGVLMPAVYFLAAVLGC